MCVCVFACVQSKTKSFGREKDPRHFHLYIYICAPFDQITMENMSSSIFFCLLQSAIFHFRLPARCIVQLWKSPAFYRPLRFILSRYGFHVCYTFSTGFGWHCFAMAFSNRTSLYRPHSRSLLQLYMQHHNGLLLCAMHVRKPHSWPKRNRDCSSFERILFQFNTFLKRYKIVPFHIQMEFINCLAQFCWTPWPKINDSNNYRLNCFVKCAISSEVAIKYKQ